MSFPFRQVHLDFHTGPKIPSVGGQFSKEDFQQALITGHVNSITCFSKCHHGYSYHPVKTGEMHPALRFDLLGAQMEACREIGVRIPGYISAGHDQLAAIAHPEWVIHDKSFEEFSFNPGMAHYALLCLNSPYLEYLEAQVIELLERYDVDEVFLDICNIRRCYCDSCRAEMEKRGIDYINDDRAVDAFAEEVYVNYFKRIRKAIDTVKPGLPVFHNGGHIKRGRRDWARLNTHLELESLPTGGWGYDHFPLSAAYARTLDMDFLGMTARFHGTWADFGTYKHPNALRYEAALSIANGSRCSIGDQLHPDGKMDKTAYEVIGEAYSYVEQCEPWCTDTQSVADAALLSLEAFIPDMSPKSDVGAIRMLLEGHYLFDVIDAEADFSKYKVIILPDAVGIDAALKGKIDRFIADGGKLLATGEAGLDENGAFAFDFGCKHEGRCEYNPTYLRPLFETPPFSQTAFCMKSETERITLTDGKILAEQQNPYFQRGEGGYICSHFHTPVNPDTVAPGVVLGKDGMYIACKVFQDYASTGHLILRKIFEYALDSLLDAKTLCVDLPSTGVTTLMRKADGTLIHHLLFATPVKRGEMTQIIEDAVPLYNIPVRLRTGKKPKAVRQVPDNKAISFSYENGELQYTLEKLALHAMVEISF